MMVGQGPDLAPADGRLYALRDVTSTVEFEPFIVSSIVSKKIAEGARALVFDVKCGSGAFMKSRDAAGSLARRLVATTRALGASASALVTEMSQPLGEAIGNALEVRESIDVLRGTGPADTRELTLDLASEMLVLAGRSAGRAEARTEAEARLADGSAWRRFIELVRAQGGDVGSVEQPERLARAPIVAPVPAPRAGYVHGCDAFALGELVVAIGGGRRAKDDTILPAVGLTMRCQRGQAMRAGEPLADLHLMSEDAGAVRRAAACFEIEPAPPGTSHAGRVLERIA